MDIRLDGKVAIVTGGSRGIGKAIAQVFADSGAKVMITSRNEESCAAAAAEIGENAVYEAGHIGRDEDADRVVQSTMDQFGQVDILINNAAIFTAAPLVEIDRADYQRAFDINVSGTLFTMQAVAQHMIARGQGGKIINKIGRAHG